MFGIEWLGIYNWSGNMIHFHFYVDLPLYIVAIFPPQSIYPVNAAKRLPMLLSCPLSSYLKAIARHAALVLVDGALAIFLRVIALAEQHAFVA
jgi:hypothetical protein